MKKLIVASAVSIAIATGCFVGFSSSSVGAHSIGGHEILENMKCTFCNGTGFNGSFDCTPCKGTGRVNSY